MILLKNPSIHHICIDGFVMLNMNGCYLTIKGNNYPKLENLIYALATYIIY